MDEGINQLQQKIRKQKTVESIKSGKSRKSVTSGKSGEQSSNESSSSSGLQKANTQFMRMNTKRTSIIEDDDERGS